MWIYQQGFGASSTTPRPFLLAGFCFDMFSPFLGPLLFPPVKIQFGNGVLLGIYRNIAIRVSR